MRDNPFVRTVLSPIGIDDFFSVYWERQALHIERDAADHFGHLVSAASIEDLLNTQDVHFPECQLTQSGRHVDPAEYTGAGDRIEPRRLLQRHVEGATLVLSRAHRRFHGLSSLISETVSALQWRCQANVYLSPPGRQGFNPHYDTHDVFILQVSGAKRFRFYRGGVRLPLPSDSFDPDVEILPEVMDEILLKAGETLYIPRGLAHDALADENQASLHVTLGVFPVCEVDVLRQCLRIASERQLDLRRSVSRAAWAPTRDESGSPIDIGTAADPARHSALELSQYRDEALSRLRDGVFLDAEARCQGALTGSSARDGIPLDAEDTLTLVEAPLLVERTARGLKVRRPGQVLEFEGAMASAVESLMSAGSIRIGDWHGLDEPQQVSLAERLLVEALVDRNVS